MSCVLHCSCTFMYTRQQDEGGCILARRNSSHTSTHMHVRLHTIWHKASLSQHSADNYATKKQQLCKIAVSLQQQHSFAIMTCVLLCSSTLGQRALDATRVGPTMVVKQSETERHRVCQHPIHPGSIHTVDTCAAAYNRVLMAVRAYNMGSCQLRHS